MSYPLGQSVTRAVQVKDATGTLVNASTCVLTVTQPDGTTTTPSVTNPTTGNYSASFLPTLVGHYSYEWVSTNPNTALNDSFNVGPAFTLALTSLDAVKSRLGIPSTDTSRDELLWSYINAATDQVSYLSETILPTVYTDEVHSGGRDTIVLFHSPIISVASITEYIGQTPYVLTDTEAGQNNPYGYSIDNKNQGIISRRWSSFVGQFMSGTNNIVVTYTAGLSSVPANITNAVLDDIQVLFNQTQQQGPNSNPETGWTTPPVQAFPRLKFELAATARVPTVA